MLVAMSISGQRGICSAAMRSKSQKARVENHSVAPRQFVQAQSAVTEQR